jgi:hypothetical protein
MSERNNKELVMEFQRIRNVKPQFFSHEGLYDAEVKAGVPVRLGFIGLWTCCDKNGRFEWKPRQLKLKALPYDEIDFNKVLEALVETDSIRKYEVDGKQYGYIPSWRKHQYVSPKELKVKSHYPAPPGVEDAPEAEEDSPENGPDIVEEPNRVGTGAVPEPGQAVSMGNGNGKEWESAGNVNVGSKAAQSQSQSAAPHSFDKLHSQSQSETPTPLGSKETSHSSAALPFIGDSAGSMNGNGRPKWVKPGVLSVLLYEALPAETQKEAVNNWEKLWTKDFEELCYKRKLPSMEVADTLLFALGSRFKKYVTHAKPFVKMYDDIREVYEEKAAKPGVVEKIMVKVSAKGWQEMMDRVALTEDFVADRDFDGDDL